MADNCFARAGRTCLDRLPVGSGLRLEHEAYDVRHSPPRVGFLSTCVECAILRLGSAGGAETIVPSASLSMFRPCKAHEPHGFSQTSGAGSASPAWTAAPLVAKKMDCTEF